ncbi:MAG: hypothetical protein ACREL7_15475 [Longimicrobiales bacterium]
MIPAIAPILPVAGGWRMRRSSGSAAELTDHFDGGRDKPYAVLVSFDGCKGYVTSDDYAAFEPEDVVIVAGDIIVVADERRLLQRTGWRPGTNRWLRRLPDSGRMHDRRPPGRASADPGRDVAASRS